MVKGDMPKMIFVRNERFSGLKWTSDTIASWFY